MMINVFKTIKAAKRFLSASGKTLKGKGVNKAADKVVSAWKKTTGHSHTTLRDMAMKKKAFETKVQPYIRSQKYKNKPNIKPKGGYPKSQSGWAEYLRKIPPKK